MSTATKPSITIFGSTGGSGLSILRLALQSLLQTTVLVRTPTKLLSLLEVPSAPSNLRIIQGDIHDADAVSAALTTAEGKMSDIIISCVGIPQPEMSLKTLWNPFAGADVHICRDGVAAQLAAIKGLRAKGVTTADARREGPLLVAFSTTGISSAGRDIPLRMVPLYSMIGVPHKDKKEMETIIAAEPGLRWCIIRPSFFGWGGKASPADDEKVVRIGIERDGVVEKREMGSNITKEACGKCVFENLVAGYGEKSEWEGAMVSLTF